MLRLRNFGVKFRRQTVIGQYIVDFVCFEKRLIIEVDGGQHAQSENDQIRDQWLKSQGFEVLRFWNHDVLNNRQAVLEKIIDQLKSPSLTLPTRGRESLKNKLIQESKLVQDTSLKVLYEIEKIDE